MNSNVKKKQTVEVKVEKPKSATSAVVNNIPKTRNISPLEDECIKLLRAKEYRSCEILAMYHLSSTSPSNSEMENLSQKATAYEILGDCATNQNQHRRAIAFYKKALAHLKSKRPVASASVHNILLVHSSTEANLKLKQARSLSKLGNITEAASVLESSIPRSHSLRTFAISMELGKLYQLNGRIADAKRSYLDALSRNVYTMEAIERLVGLNAERSEVMKVVNEAIKKKGSDGKENQKKNQGTEIPIADIVTAYFYSERSTSSHQANALSQWKKLHAEYPQNIYVLLQMAMLQTKHPNCDVPYAALGTFKKIRNLDLNFVEGMDCYAGLLAKQCNLAELGRLNGDLLQIDDTKSEAWIALALYHDACGDSDKAIAFADKGIACDPQNSFCHKLKGSILLSQGRPDIAGSCFFRANEIKRDISSYEGMVESCLIAKRYKEAICTAKEAMAFAPRDSRALTLVGLALSRATSSSKDNGGMDRAKKALRKALSYDPLAMRPLMALVDLHTADHEYDICIELLEKGIEDGGETSVTGTSTSPMFTTNSYDRQVILLAKLGDIYSNCKRYQNSLTCYHKALSLNPDCVEAQRGVAHLEAKMKGIDPDSSEAYDDDGHYVDYNDGV
jgi:anaphase-promoting complex subunit 7